MNDKSSPMKALPKYSLLVMASLLLAACGTDAPPPDEHAGHSEHTAEAPTPMPSPMQDAEDPIVTIDAATVQQIGVRVATVVVEPLTRTFRTTGRFEMDEQGAHTVALKVGGWVEKLHIDYEGAIVQAGQPLLEMYSPELVATQQEYLLALKNAERMAGSTLSTTSEDATRLVEAARRRLSFWDIADAQIERLEETGTPMRTLTFPAPVGGEVMEKYVVQGQHVQPGQPLMKIFDLSRIWLIMDVYEQDLAWVEEGQTAQIELPYAPGETFSGRIDHIYYMLDDETRAAKARIVLPGRRAQLKPGMYATVTIEGKPTPPSPLVPEEAVLLTGERAVVILALGDGRFAPVDVEVGMLSDGQYQILSGLQGGEHVVTSAQFLIDSEARLKSAIGAMMAGHDHGSMGDTEAPKEMTAPDDHSHH